MALDTMGALTTGLTYTCLLKTIFAGYIYTSPIARANVDSAISTSHSRSQTRHIGVHRQGNLLAYLNCSPFPRELPAISAVNEGLGDETGAVCNIAATSSFLNVARFESQIGLAACYHISCHISLNTAANAPPAIIRPPSQALGPV